MPRKTCTGSSECERWGGFAQRGVNDRWMGSRRLDDDDPDIDCAALQQEIVSNSSYRLAEEDVALLGENDLRPLRLHLELVKAVRVMRDRSAGSPLPCWARPKRRP